MLPAAFGLRETACSSLFLQSYSTFRRQYAISSPDSVSIQKPRAHVESVFQAHEKSCRPVRAASDRALDSLRCAHPPLAPARHTARLRNPPPPEHLLFAPASCEYCPGTDSLRSDKSRCKTSTRTGSARCSCTLSGKHPDKHPGLHAQFPSGAAPDAAPPGRSGAPALRRQHDCRAAPRAPGACRRCGSDSTCGPRLRAAVFHCFVPPVGRAQDVPGREVRSDENTCQPEIVLPTHRPASLLSLVAEALTLPGYKEIDGATLG